jgi:hypothetical protein
MRQASVAETASKPPTIAQQLMLGGTISAQRDQDETAGLTKIAGVRNGAARNGVAPTAAPVVAPKAAIKAVVASPAKRQKEREPRAPTRAARADKTDKAIRAAIEISIDDVLKASPSPKTRGGRRAPSIQGSMEEQLHSLALRLGTQRAREIIEEIEKTALTAS